MKRQLTRIRREGILISILCLMGAQVQAQYFGQGYGRYPAGPHCAGQTAEVIIENYGDVAETRGKLEDAEETYNELKEKVEKRLKVLDKVFLKEVHKTIKTHFEEERQFNQYKKDQCVTKNPATAGSSVTPPAAPEQSEIDNIFGTASKENGDNNGVSTVTVDGVFCLEQKNIFRIALKAGLEKLCKASKLRRKTGETYDEKCYEALAGGDGEDDKSLEDLYSEFNEAKEKKEEFEQELESAREKAEEKLKKSNKYDKMEAQNCKTCPILYTRRPSAGENFTNIFSNILNIAAHKKIYDNAIDMAGRAGHAVQAMDPTIYAAMSLGYGFNAQNTYGASYAGLSRGGFACSTNGYFNRFGQNGAFSYPSSMMGGGGPFMGPFVPGAGPWGYNGPWAGAGNMGYPFGAGFPNFNGMAAGPYGLNAMMNPYGMGTNPMGMSMMDPLGMGMNPMMGMGMNPMMGMGMNPMMGMGMNPMMGMGMNPMMGMGMNPMMGMGMNPMMGMNPFGANMMNPFGGGWNSPFPMPGLQGQMGMQMQQQMMQMQQQQQQAYMQYQQQMMNYQMQRQRAQQVAYQNITNLTMQIQRLQMQVSQAYQSIYSGVGGGLFGGGAGLPGGASITANPFMNYGYGTTGSFSLSGNPNGNPFSTTLPNSSFSFPNTGGGSSFFGNGTSTNSGGSTTTRGGGN